MVNVDVLLTSLHRHKYSAIQKCMLFPIWSTWSRAWLNFKLALKPKWRRRHTKSDISDVPARGSIQLNFKFFQRNFASTTGCPTVLPKLFWKVHQKVCWNSIELTPWARAPTERALDLSKKLASSYRAVDRASGLCIGNMIFGRSAKED